MYWYTVTTLFVARYNFFNYHTSDIPISNLVHVCPKMQSQSLTSNICSMNKTLSIKTLCSKISKGKHFIVGWCQTAPPHITIIKQ